MKLKCGVTIKCSRHRYILDTMIYYNFFYDKFFRPCIRRQGKLQIEPKIVLLRFLVKIENFFKSHLVFSCDF
jgi:hypothetical protein